MENRQKPSYAWTKKWPKTYDRAELAQNREQIWTQHAYKPYNNHLFDLIDGFEFFLISLVQILSYLPLFQEGDNCRCCFLTGLGVSMNIACSLAIIPHYFEKRKSVAYACIGLGEGIALVALPYIMKALLDAHGFKLTFLYISPITLLALLGAVLFMPQQETGGQPLRGKALVRSYFGSLKKMISPFYLFNAMLFGGELSGVVVLGFQYLVKVSDVSVALLCYSIMGIAYLIGSLLFVLYLIKFQINHYILQITINATLGLATIVVTFMHWPAGYYVCFAVIGIVYGLTISNMPCVGDHLYSGSDVEYAYGFQQVAYKPVFTSVGLC